MVASMGDREAGVEGEPIKVLKPASLCYPDSMVGQLHCTDFRELKMCQSHGGLEILVFFQAQ